MSIFTCTRPAKCKDCAYLSRIKIGKLTRHKCKNIKALQHNTLRGLNDLVCARWGIINKEGMS